MAQVDNPLLPDEIEKCQNQQTLQVRSSWPGYCFDGEVDQE